MTASSVEGNERSQLKLIWAADDTQAKFLAHQKNVLIAPAFDEYAEAVIPIDVDYLRDWANGLYLVGAVYQDCGKTILNVVVITSLYDLNAVGHAIKLRFAQFKPVVTGMQVKGFTRLWASIRARN